jgi:carboxynorspermidine decarboxylase
MDLTLIKNKLSSSPAFVLDENTIVKNLIQLGKLKQQSGCKVLYSVKALPLEPVLKLAKGYLDGLAVSSLFEARLAKEILAEEGSIHITTPGLRADEFQEISGLCTHISFNSLSQFQHLNNFDTKQCSLGLRLNPKLSYTNDPRFDPCRPHSKLGVDIESLGTLPEKIEGLHFHTVFSNTNYQSLIETVALLKEKSGHNLTQLKWLNLGGGYLHSQIANHQPFIDLIKQLKSDYELDIYIEPGKAIVGNAGYLITTVIDSFSSDGKFVAVLDTSVNHNPEVFEYQRQPELLEADYNGKYACILAGSSCLAGDVFGEYPFEVMPKVGDRLVFSNVGAYSLIKANRFNGYNLPDIYLLNRQHKIALIIQSTYQQYREQWKGY